MRVAHYVIVAGSFTLLAVCAAPVLSQKGGVTEYGSTASVSKSSTAAVSSDLAPYLSVLEKKIADRGPKKFIGQVTITFKLDKAGAASNFKMTKSSGMPQIDTAAMSAVKSSAPFEPLPSGAGKTIDVQVTFEGTSQTSTCHAIRMR